MKKIWVILGILIFAGIISLGVWGFSKGGPSSKTPSYTQGDPTAPKMELAEKSFNFGKIKLEDVVKHDFKIKNEGKSPLVISSISTSCHCATAVLKISGKKDSPSFGMNAGSWSGEIPSVGEATLEVTYKPQDHPVKGPVTRMIYFSTNDPSQPDGKVEVLANVE